MVERGKRVDDDPNLLLAQAEKLLQSIKEASKLDNSVTFQELSFSRTKLRDIYRSLLLVNLEISLDKKIEQELWNQCYKSPISYLQEQQKSKTVKPELRQEAALNLSELLEQAYGFYLRLLDEICDTYALEINSRASEKQLKMINTMAHDKEKPRSASSNYIAQHCLVHLGDIARYRHKGSMADSYYRKAAQIVPSNGQPYNQLAILASPQSDMLSTVFFYLRAIYVKCPFPGSKLNLERTLEKVLKSRQKQNVKQANKISVLELLRLFLKFHAIIYTSAPGDDTIDRVEFAELYARLIGAIEVHLSLGGLSRRQLLQITFISIVNLHKSHQQSNQFAISYSTKYLLALLDLLIRPPVDPTRHLPSVLSILQSLEHNSHLVNNSQSPVWPHLALMLNRTLPPDWSAHWRPTPSPLPEDVEFRGWVLWRLPDCIDFSLPVTAESEQTDARAERILLTCRAMATNEAFNSVLRIEFNQGQNGHFKSPVIITQPDNFEKANIEPPLIAPPPSAMAPMAPVVPPPPAAMINVPPPPVVPRGVAPDFGNIRPILSEPRYPPPLLYPPPQPQSNHSRAPPPLQPPLGPPPPGPPPPEVLSNLPPELFNLLRHIPPPVIGQQQGSSGPSDQRQSFQPRFPSSTSPPQKQTVTPQQAQQHHQTYQPTTNNTNPKFDKFEPFRPFQPGRTYSPPFDRVGGGGVPSQLPLFNPVSPGVIPGDNSSWSRAPGPAAGIRSPSQAPPIPSVQHQMHQAPQMPVPVTGQQQQRFRSDGSGDLMFNPFQQTTTKPIFDPNSYDRKIESVSQLWDPKSPRSSSGGSNTTDQIWAPLRAPTPPMESLAEQFLDSLPKQ